MSSPKQAADLLQSKRYEDAMDALLFAWRTHRAPQLERAIASLSDQLVRGVEPIDVDADDWQEQWERRARDKRAVELGVLLAHVTRLPKGGIPRRVRGLLGYGGDPRIGAVLLDIIEHPPLTASSNFSMWTELFAGLPEHVDERARARLEARAAEPGGKSQFWTKLQAWINAALPKLSKPARLPAAWKDELAELQRAIASLADQPALELRAAPAAQTETVVADVDDLALVRASLDAGQLATAIDQLVSYWGQLRSPTVAALIDRLGVLVDQDQAPPGGRTAKQRQEAWIDAAEHARPSTIGPLLASLRDAKLADVEARLEMLSDWRPDPRVAQAMLLFVKDHMLGARNRLWKAVYEALLHHADPRVAEDVHKRHAGLADAHVLHRHIAEGREIRRVYERFCEVVEAEHRLTADQAEHAEAIGRALAERMPEDGREDDLERGLVEAMVRAWDDDAPRLVYADWLQSRNDPRGEFIALDIALTQGKRVKGARDKSFKTHKQALFGPLAGLIHYGEKFERGLLTHARISTRKGGLDVGEDRRREILGDLRWAQLRSMDVSYNDGGVAEVFEHAPLLALERLERPGLAALRGFARRSDTVPVKTLGISGSSNDADEAWDEIGALSRVLPEVEEIEVMIWGRDADRVTPPLAWFRGELCRRTKLLVNGDKSTGGVARLDEWLERMLAAKCPVPALRIVSPELSAEARQIAPGRFEIDLTIGGLRRLDDPDTNVTLAAVRGLPRASIDSVKLRLKNIADEVRPEIDAALEGLAITD